MSDVLAEAIVDNHTRWRGGVLCETVRGSSNVPKDLRNTGARAVNTSRRMDVDGHDWSARSGPGQATHHGPTTWRCDKSAGPSSTV